LNEPTFVLALLKNDKWFFYNKGEWVESVGEAKLFKKENALSLCEKLAKENMDVVVFNSKIFGI